jgi:hypothetical protein
VRVIEIIDAIRSRRNAMTDTRPFDPALFHDASIDPDTANLNTQMIELLTDQPEGLLGEEPLEHARRSSLTNPGNRRISIPNSTAWRSRSLKRGVGKPWALAVGRRTREIDQDPIAHVLGDKAVEPATVSATAGSSGRLRSGSTAPASRFHGAVLDSMD